jgi:CubicO group peptidase (beta-lactamase class C family)
MTANSPPTGVRFAGAVGDFIGPAAGSGWGLGFAIRTDPKFSGVPGGLGSFGWGGAWGATFWIDPAHDLIALQMIQVDPAAAGTDARALRPLLYAGKGRRTYAHRLHQEPSRGGHRRRPQSGALADRWRKAQ